MMRWVPQMQARTKTFCFTNRQGRRVMFASRTFLFQLWITREMIDSKRSHESIWKPQENMERPIFDLLEMCILHSCAISRRSHMSDDFVFHDTTPMRRRRIQMRSYDVYRQRRMDALLETWSWSQYRRHCWCSGTNSSLEKMTQRASVHWSEVLIEFSVVVFVLHIIGNSR